MENMLGSHNQTLPSCSEQCRQSSIHANARAQQSGSLSLPLPAAAATCLVRNHALVALPQERHQLAHLQAWKGKGRKRVTDTEDSTRSQLAACKVRPQLGCPGTCKFGRAHCRCA